jgi:hypothetical protein
VPIPNPCCNVRRGGQNCNKMLFRYDGTLEVPWV